MGNRFHLTSESGRTGTENKFTPRKGWTRWSGWWVKMRGGWYHKPIQFYFQAKQIEMMWRIQSYQSSHCTKLSLSSPMAISVAQEWHPFLNKNSYQSPKLIHTASSKCSAPNNDGQGSYDRHGHVRSVAALLKTVIHSYLSFSTNTDTNRLRELGPLKLMLYLI